MILEYSIYDTVGLCGTFLYFFSYFLLNMKKVTGNSAHYIGLNLVAACLCLISLMNDWNLASALTQIGFGLISIYGLIIIAIENKKDKQPN
jgi:hypothetical protein